MEKIILNINPSIYEYIMFFLENIPKNLIKIEKDLSIQNNFIKNSSINRLRKLQGVGKELYKDIDSNRYIRDLRDEW